jgi:hypothetical protein
LRGEWARNSSYLSDGTPLTAQLGRGSLQGVDLRLVLGCALAFGVAAGAFAATGERVYTARAFVVRVPPEVGRGAGVDLARSEPVLRRTLNLAGERRLGTRWLRAHSSVELTSRLDLALTVDAPGREQSVTLATAYAKAVRRSIPDQPGLLTRGQGARDAQPGLGALGWALVGATAGLWVGAALAIVRDGMLRRGSGPGPRPASSPCAPARRATPG